MGSHPLPNISRHRDIQGTRDNLHFSLRSALAWGYSSQDRQTLVFSNLQALGDACFDKPCCAVQARG